MAATAAAMTSRIALSTVLAVKMAAAPCNVRRICAAGRRRPHYAAVGFTLIELMIVVAIVAILAAIALPSYSQYIVRGSRQAAQTDLLELSTIQEKIFLNSNAYTANVTGGYTGLSTGGLGKTTGRTRDSRYTLSAAVTGVTFTLTAAPVVGSGQAGDGDLVLTSAGERTWGSATW